jgi:hypothetical protein
MPIRVSLNSIGEKTMYIAIIPLLVGCGGTLLLGSAALVVGVTVGTKAIKELTKDKRRDENSPA